MSKRSSSSSGPEEKKQRRLEEEAHDLEEDEHFVPYVPLRERRKIEAGTRIL